jgi:hypothetical protein
MDIEHITKMYLSGMSTYKIGEELKLNPNTIWVALKKAGVKTRSKKEALEKYAKRDICIVCNKEFRVRKDWKHGNHYRRTCSPDCESTYRSITVKESYTEDRKKQLSEKLKGRIITWHVPCGTEKPNWRGGRTSYTYNRIAFEEYKLEKVCSVCGTQEQICVHHKDQNRSNNSRDNLQIICKRCHASLHSKGNALWKKHLGL